MSEILKIASQCCFIWVYALRIQCLMLFLKELVPAEFLFFDPKTEDFHGVKTLLQTYLDDKEWDLSGFVDLILGQTTVGAVVKLEKDEDNGIFSVVSALNLGRYKASNLPFKPLQIMFP